MRKKLREKIVEDLLKEHPLEEIVSFNEFNLPDKLAENSAMFIKYHELYLAEKQELDHLLTLKLRLTGTIYDEFRFSQEKNLDKKEIERYYIPNNPKIKKLESIIEHQRVRVEFFEIAAKAIDNMRWNMKNFLESDKVLH